MLCAFTGSLTCRYLIRVLVFFYVIYNIHFIVFISYEQNVCMVNIFINVDKNRKYK